MAKSVKQLDKKYYINHFDMNDGWLGWEYIQEFRPEWIFSDFDKAYACCNELNEKLAFGNVSCGERYEVKERQESCELNVDAMILDVYLNGGGYSFEMENGVAVDIHRAEDKSTVSIDCKSPIEG